MARRIYLVEMAVENDLPPIQDTPDRLPSIEDVGQALAAALGYKRHSASGNRFIIDADSIEVIGTREG